MARKMAMIDWRAMKYYQTRIFIILPFVLLVGVVYSSILVLPTSVFMFMAYSVNPFAVEEKGEVNNLYLTLPVQRNNIVAGRYILSVLMALFGLAAGLPIMFLANKIGFSHYYYPLSWNLFIVAASCVLYAFVNLAMFPILFKLGYSKGKFWGFMLPAIFVGALYGVAGVVMFGGNGAVIMDVLSFAGEHLVALSGGLFLLAVVILFVSYSISKHIYNKRDF